MRRSPAVAYYERKIRTTRRSVLYEEIEDAPLKIMDRNFLHDVIDGLSYKELSVKYCKSTSRIYRWKRSLFERMHKYDLQNYSETSF